MALEEKPENSSGKIPKISKSISDIQQNPESSEKIVNATDLKNVFLIDDAKDLREILKEFLQMKFQCNVFEAENGKEGLQAISDSKDKIHLVLCDVMMPIMDGMAFIKKLKGTVLTHKIPVIFLTAVNNKETVTKCIKLGATDFIVKPYDLEVITKKLEKFLTIKS